MNTKFYCKEQKRAAASLNQISAVWQDQEATQLNGCLVEPNLWLWQEVKPLAMVLLPLSNVKTSCSGFLVVQPVTHHCLAQSSVSWYDITCGLVAWYSSGGWRSACSPPSWFGMDFGGSHNKDPLKIHTRSKQSTILFLSRMKQLGAVI